MSQSLDMSQSPDMSQPPAARPPWLTRRGALIVVAVALLCAGGSFMLGSTSGAASQKAATLAGAANQIAGESVAPEPVAPIIEGDGVALSAHLLPPPPGAQPVVVAAGVIDVPGADAAELLASIGAKLVVSADWLRNDAVEVRTSLVQFPAPSGANSFVAATDQELVAAPAVTNHFTIPGISACFGDDDGGLDSSGRRISTLLCADGTIAVVISTYAPGPVNDRTEIQALQQQIDALSH